MGNILQIFVGTTLLRLMYIAESMVGFAIAAVCESNWRLVVNNGEK